MMPPVIPSKLKLVLDTASFVAAIRSPTGAAGRLLDLIVQREVQILMDYKISLEYREVGLRAEHLRAGGVSAGEVLAVIQVLEEIAIPISVSRSWRPLSPDPDDDMILDLAISGRAEVLVTANRKHFSPVADRFGILVLTSAQFLERIRKETLDVH